jgi:hypothetical protein
MKTKLSSHYAAYFPRRANIRETSKRVPLATQAARSCLASFTFAACIAGLVQSRSLALAAQPCTPGIILAESHFESGKVDWRAVNGLTGERSGRMEWWWLITFREENVRLSCGASQVPGNQTNAYGGAGPESPGK